MEPGRIIGGKYRIRRLIGEGGMGAVWSAVHEALDRTVAIKFLRPAGADAETASARFVTEAKSAARVKHRFVVDVFDFGITEDGIYYMVQELLEGEELADCLVHGPAWEVRDVVSFIAQCLSGLEAVHQAGIVHRDLKPENIFVMRDSDGRYPKLLDFGISKLADASGARASGRPPPVRIPGRAKQLTTKGTTVGTPWYMSPEQLRGRRDLDGRADLYSIGVILYEWLIGRVPYEHENTAELSLQIASGSATPLITFRPDLGHGLSSVVARALAPEPDQRFASAAAMREALTEILPSIPSAFSVVQKSAKGAPIGARTEVLLKSAKSPFHEDDDPRDQTPGIGPSRMRPWMWAVGAAIVIGLSTLPFLLHPEPPRAGAAGHPASAQHEAHAATPEDVPGALAPAPAVEPVASRPSGPVVEALPSEPSAPIPPDSAASDPESQRTQNRAKRPSSASAKSAAGSSKTPRSAARAKSDKKVIRTLDF